MRILNYLTLIFGLFFTSWTTVTAYNNVVKVVQFNDLPLFLQQRCTVTQVDILDEKETRRDLSIYYSGVARMNEEDIITMHDKNIPLQNKMIQDEIVKIVKDKQQDTVKKVEQEKNATTTTHNQKKPQHQLEKKSSNKNEQKASGKKIWDIVNDDDAFSYKKEKVTKSVKSHKEVDKKKVISGKKSNSVFDVLD